MCCFDLPQYDDICRRASSRDFGGRTRSRQNEQQYHHHTGMLKPVFTIPGKSRLLQSGFPYHESLVPAQVHLSYKLQLSATIASCVRQTAQDRFEILTRGLVSGSMLLLMIGPFCLPAGISAARSCARAIEQEKLRKVIQLDQTFNQVLREWTALYFFPRRLIVRLDVPDDGHEDIQVPCTCLERRENASNNCNLVTKEGRVFVLWVRYLKKPRLVVTRVHL